MNYPVALRVRDEALEHRYGATNQTENDEWIALCSCGWTGANWQAWQEHLKMVLDAILPEAKT